MRKVLWVVAVLFLASGAAWADLCEKCRGQMYPMHVGTCQVCGGQTPSGAFQICPACSKKLGQCENCRGPLAVATGTKTVDKPMPVATTKVDTGTSGAYQSGKWTYTYEIHAKGSKSERRSGVLAFDGKPIEGAAMNDRIKTPWGVMQYFDDPAGDGWNSGWLLKQTYDDPINPKKGRLLPDPEVWAKRIAERKKALVDDLDNFVLALNYYGPQDKPFYTLTLSVTAIDRKKSTQSMLDAVVEKETALKIIDWLAESGALGHADDLGLSQDGELAGPAGPCYLMSVSGGKMALRYDLGWEMPMLRELLRLRGRLNGDAAKQMDVFMGRLSGYIKEWTGNPYRPPD